MELEALKEWWGFEAERLEDEEDEDEYVLICKEAKKLGFRTIYDIGCAYGPYIGYILKQGFDYVGIEEEAGNEFCEHPDIFEVYDVSIRFGTHFPCEVSPKPNSCAISVCALGSLFAKNEIPAQMEQLKKEFKHFFCCSFPESIGLMQHYWEHCNVLLNDGKRCIVHFWND